MKRICVVLCVCWAAMNVAAKDAVNVVFIGNSITAGATLKNSKVDAPPYKVGKMLGEKTGCTVNVTNCGASGSTTFDWLPGKGNFKRAFDAAAKYQQEGGQLVFSICLGTNDSAQDRCNGAPVNPDVYAANLRSIILELLIHYPLAVYVVNYPLWYSPNTHNGANYEAPGLARLQTYYPILNTLVARFRQEQFPVYGGNDGVFKFFENKTELFTPENGQKGVFHLHPNLEGGTALAEIWTNALVDALTAAKVLK